MHSSNSSLLLSISHSFPPPHKVTHTVYKHPTRSVATDQEYLQKTTSYELPGQGSIVK